MVKQRKVGHTLLRILLAVGFIAVGWSFGVAQAPVADFEITIEAPRGGVKLTCARGCDWRSEPGQESPQTVTSRCETEKCLRTYNGADASPSGTWIGKGSHVETAAGAAGFSRTQGFRTAGLGNWGFAASAPGEARELRRGRPASFAAQARIGARHQSAASCRPSFDFRTTLFS